MQYANQTVDTLLVVSPISLNAERLYLTLLIRRGKSRVGERRGEQLRDLFPSTAVCVPTAVTSSRRIFFRSTSLAVSTDCCVFVMTRLFFNRSFLCLNSRN